MAVIKRGILGGFSNKIGNVVGTSWKGIAVMKSLPLSVANPRTTGQVNQRTNFAGISKIGSVLLATIVKPLWDRFAQEESGYNAFVRANIGTMQDGVIFLAEQFKISEGKMAAVNPSTASLNNTTNNAVITWSTALPDAFAAASDKVYVVITGGSAEDTRGYATSAVRSAGTVTVVYPYDPPATGLVGYLAFARADGTVVSDTGTLELTIS